MSEKIEKISSDKITDPVNPMRSNIDRDKIWELADSIKREGLINPITVRPKGDKFEVVAGHRRFMACRIAGLIEISCVIRELTDVQAGEIMAHENLFRENIDPVDEALFLGKLIGADAAKIPEYAERLNRSEQWIRDRLEILEYPDYLIQYVKLGNISLGCAHNLFRIKDMVYCKMYADSAAKAGMSIRQADYLACQYEMGLLVPSETIIPANSELANSEPPVFRARCAKCGEMAEEPNVQSVFIHKKCENEQH